MPGPVPPAGPSTSAVVGSITGGGIAIYVIDRLLAADGQLASAMLTKLSPLAGPLWASWPLIVLIVIVAWVIRDKWTAAQAARALEVAVIHDKWTAAQAARALEVAAQQASATALATSVGEVATGLVGLRAEVHSLRGALQDHATATDERLRHHEAGLGELRSEVSHVRGRVDVLERPATRPPASARARRPT